MLECRKDAGYLSALRVALGNQNRAERYGYDLEMNLDTLFATERTMCTIGPVAQISIFVYSVATDGKPAQADLIRLADGKPAYADPICALDAIAQRKP